uniref:Conserved domain protein n=1 Tax=Heterorhabditis bacteriophora TaxID=37862 RepID=A0A1I7XT06_HETBA
MSQYCPITDEEVARTDASKQGRKTSLCQVFPEIRLGKSPSLRNKTINSLLRI